MGLGEFLGNVVKFLTVSQLPKAPEAARPSRINHPTVEPGSIYPLVYGRVRCRNPVLAWAGNHQAEADGSAFNYRLDMFYLMGIPFLNGRNRMHTLWVGDTKYPTGDLGTLSGDGGATFATVVNDLTAAAAGQGLFGTRMQLHAGSATQDMTNFTIHDRMVTAGVDSSTIPGYRGYIGISFFNNVGAWALGNSPDVGAYNVEISTYAETPLYGTGKVGVEANPIDVIYDLLASSMGKAEISTEYIDSVTFELAARTCSREGYGFSREFPSRMPLAEMLAEVERHIDGKVYQDPTDGKIKIRLIRDDYDPATLDHIGVNNCIDVVDYDAGSLETAPDKIRVVYSSRARGYVEDSEVAVNQALMVSRGSIDERVIHYPGCCTAAQAMMLASRDISVMSRAIATCRALVSRAFYDKVPGDCVILDWPARHVFGKVFRVANVDRGTTATSAVALDLVEDYYYVHRNQPPQAGGLPAFNAPPE